MDKVILSVKTVNETLLCKKVCYGEGNIADPNDETNVWFQVSKSKSEKIVPGDLVRSNIRHMTEHIIEGEYFYEVKENQISLIIESKDVKTDLFK